MGVLLSRSSQGSGSSGLPSSKGPQCLDLRRLRFLTDLSRNACQTQSDLKKSTPEKGMLLGNFISVTMIRKPYDLLYAHI